MQYVRFREKLKGDIGRITRQQKFIKAVLKKVKSPAILLKIPKIMSIIYDNLSTDMDIVTMLKLLNCYKSMPGLSAVSLNTLPGIPKYIDKKSYFVADLPKFEKLYQKFFPSFFKTPAVPDPTNSIDSGAEEPKGSKLSLTPEQGVFKELTSESDSAHGAADEAE
jgi:anionic cell wall polymer biosynthesis LytR-Cps2A-Psr (LCP) family protein